LEETVAAPVYKTEITVVGVRRADHARPLYPQKLALTSPTSDGRSVGIYEAFKTVAVAQSTPTSA
jgi:hypothetical protein